MTGYAFRQKLTAAGARQIVSISIPGEALLCTGLYLDVAHHGAQTLTPAEVAFIPQAVFRDLADSRGAIKHAILIQALIEGSILREWMTNIGRRDARGRIAHLLCELAARLEAVGLAGRDGYELPMTQEQIGDAVGLTSVHVNRTLRSLQRDGLLDREGRWVRFPDEQALRKVADFSDRYLHLTQRISRKDVG